MTSLDETRMHQAGSARLRRLGFFALAFLFLYLLVDPKRVFFAHGTVFKLPIFAEYDALAIGRSTKPGGVGEFASEYLMKYFGRAWVGPVVLTLLIGLLCWSANRLTASVCEKPVPAVGYIPAILLLVILGRGDLPLFCLVYAVPMAAALVLAAAHAFLPRKAFVRLPVLVVFSLLVFVFGAGAVLLFSAACAIHEILGRRQALLGLAAIALGIAIPYLAAWVVYDVSLPEAYLRLTPFAPQGQRDATILHCALFLSVPLAMIAARLLGKWGQTRRAVRPHFFKLAWTVESLLLLVITAAVATSSFHRELHTLLEPRPVSLHGLRGWVTSTETVNLPFTCNMLLSGSALLLALFASGFYLRVSSDKPLVRWGVFLYISIFVYYAAGAAVFLFGAVCVVCEMLFARRRKLGTAELICLLALPAAWAMAIGRAGPLSGYTRLVPFLPGIAPSAGPIALRLLIILPLTAAALALWRAWQMGKTDGKADAAHLLRLRPHDRPLGPAGVWMCHSLLLFAIAAATVGAVFDWRTNARLRVNYLARLGRWEDVLKQVRHLPAPPNVVRLDVERALYQTGRLTDDMFAYPTSRLGLAPGPSWQEVLPYAEMYLEMGHTNAAEEYAYAAQAVGDHPLVLRLLGRIYLVKGQPETARVFFAALKRDPSCGHWADGYLAERKADPTLAKDRGIARLRSLAIRKDGLFTNDPIHELNNLLDANPQNRMAFEYRMAWRLLSNQLDGIVDDLPKVKTAGCRGRLRLYQEAFLVHAGDADAKTAAIDIEPETRQRFRDFEKACASAGSEADHARLVDEFGDGYFFYQRFGGD